MRMHKNLLKGVLACLLAGAMLAGCNNTTPSASSSAPVASSIGSSSAVVGPTEDDPYGKYAEPVAISLLSCEGKVASTEYDSTNPDRKSASENMWIMGYSELLNINLERIIAEDVTALSAQINTSMASGNLPDIMIVDKATFYTLVENDVLADLSEAYNTYSGSYGRLVSEAVASYPTAIDTGMVDGQLLGFPIIGNSYNSSDVLWVRQDWLDKVRKAIPTTLDEMLDVAKAFKDAKLGGDNTIGLGITDVNSSILAAYGVINDTWQKSDDGSYVYENVSDEMKDGLLKLQEIYKESLIKNDFAVTNILDEEVANGQIGMFYAAGWYGVTSVKASLTNDPDAVWVPCRIPTLDGEEVPQWTNNAISGYYVVNKDCENPEALFKMLEMELHMYYEPNAEEAPIYFCCEDGFLAWDLRAFRNFGRADADLYKSQLICEGVKNNTPLDTMAPIAKSNYELVLKGLNGDRENLGRAIVFTQSYPIVTDLLEKGMLYGSYNGPITENMTLYKKTINEALTNAYLKIVMGEDISTFDTAVAAWYSSGGQAITDEVNEYYQSLK